MLPIKIIHISDLHLGSRKSLGTHVPEIEASLASHIAQQGPDIILCTGDVVNCPVIGNGFKFAEQFFSKLRQLCPDVPIKFVAGNHDYSFYGFFGSKKHYRQRFDKFVNEDLLTCNTPFIFKGIAIFGIDSNPNFHFIRARGTVQQNDLLKLTDALKSLRKSDKEINFTLLALHHHPLPVPSPHNDSNLSMKRAGVFLHSIAKAGINVVLHGHSHYSHTTEVNLFIPDFPHRITIIGAGSVSKRDDHEPEGNHYNLLMLWPGGSITSQSFFLKDGGTFDDRSIERKIKSVRTAALERWHRSAETLQYSIERLICNININEYGDAVYRFSFIGIKARPQKELKSFKLTRRTVFGTLGLAKAIPSDHLPSLRITQAEEYDVERGHTVHCDIHLGQTLTDRDEPLDFALTIPALSSFAMNTSEYLRRHRSSESAREWTAISCLYPTKELVIKVKSSVPLFSSENVAVDIQDRNGESNPLLLKEGNMTFCDVEDNRIVAVFKNPLHGMTYKLDWGLPELNSDPQEGTAGGTLLKNLLAKEGEKLNALLKPHLEKIRDGYRQNLPSESGDQENVDVSLFLLDANRHRLKLVGALINFEKPVWEWEGFKPGAGHAGRAFHLKKHLFHSNRKREPDGYLNSEHVTVRGLGLVNHSALVSTPVVHKHNSVVGVLCIGSFDDASLLHEVEGDEDTRNKFLEYSKQANIELLTFLQEIQHK